MAAVVASPKAARGLKADDFFTARKAHTLLSTVLESETAKKIAGPEDNEIDRKEAKQHTTLTIHTVSRSVCTPPVISGAKARSAECAREEHRRELICQQTWLKKTMNRMTSERRKYTSITRWRAYLQCQFDGRRDVPAWLYHHPEDIAPEITTYRKRRGKNPWKKPPKGQNVKWDLDIFAREKSQRQNQLSSVSPCGHVYDQPEPPLPWGAKTWEEAQGKPSRGESTGKYLVRAAKCAISWIAHTSLGMRVRDHVGTFIDCRDIMWPVGLRFSKTKEQWSCP